MASGSIEALTVEDFSASRVGEEIFAVTVDAELTAGGYALGSIFRNPAFSRSHVEAVDLFLLEAFGDNYSHSPTSWVNRTGVLRRDLRSVVSTFMRGKNAHLLASVISWATAAPRSEFPPYIQNTLFHLRSDTTQTLGHLLQKESDRNWSAEVLTMLSQSVFAEGQGALGTFASTPDGVEIKWILASHPDTPPGVLQNFSPTDLQWLSVLSHPNTSQATLFVVIESALKSQYDGAMDGGNIAAALSHSWWTTDNLRGLHKRVPPYLRGELMPHLLAHPVCPLEFLETHYPRLGQPALIRLASLSASGEILEELAFHQDRLVREATKMNPRTPEHARVAAALGTLGL